MYKIEKETFGVKLTFSGFISPSEMKKWVDESSAFIRSLPQKFHVFVDMRDLKPLPAEAQNAMKEGQKIFKELGMQRSVVILNNTVTTLQFKRIAKETGIYQWERYIDASIVEDWQSVGQKWLIEEIDPDL